MKNNQTKNKKSSTVYDKTQNFCLLTVFSLLLIGIILHMLNNTYNDNQYQQKVESSFNNLLLLSDLNKKTNSGEEEMAYKISQSVSERYQNIKDLLLGDLYYKKNNIEYAKSFYNLAKSDKLIFLKKSSENRISYLSFK